MSGKGKILEEIVQRFLLTQGYRELDSNDPKVDLSTSEMKGRGTDHEMDAMGQYRYSVPFVYPIRLLGESKCYKGNKTVGVDIIREAIAVRKDVSENYQGSADFQETDRRTECIAVFSTSGFSKQARELAFAHGVYLVPMGHVLDIVNSIHSDYSPSTDREAEEAVSQFFQEQEGSQLYFGALDGTYPLALFSPPLPREMFEETDSVTVTATLMEDYDTTGADRFRIYSEAAEWSAIIEVPETDSEKMEQDQFQIYLPVVFDEIRRFLNLKGQSVDDTSA